MSPSCLLSALSAFNRKVNEEFEYRPDEEDWWMTPSQFETLGYGDCEDFAIYKFFMLGTLSFKPRMVYCFDRSGRGHMVVKVDEFLLDIQSDEVSQAWHRRDLTIVYSFDNNGIYLQDGRVVRGFPNIKPWRNVLDRMTLETPEGYYHSIESDIITVPAEHRWLCSTDRTHHLMSSDTRIYCAECSAWWYKYQSPD